MKIIKWSYSLALIACACTALAAPGEGRRDRGDRGGRGNPGDISGGADRGRMNPGGPRGPRGPEAPGLGDGMNRRPPRENRPPVNVAPPPERTPPRVRPPRNEPPVFQPPRFNPPENRPPRMRPPRIQPPRFNPEPPIRVRPPVFRPPISRPPIMRPPIGRPPIARPPSFGETRPPRFGERRHERKWDHNRRGNWENRIGRDPRWNKHNNRWGQHWSRWDSRWERRQNTINVGIGFRIDAFRWSNYWHNRYNDQYIYYPPYPVIEDSYLAETEPDFSSAPAAHYMEADVESFLNLRSSPYAQGSLNVCGQIPDGAVVSVVSVVRTSENGMAWAMIPVEDVEEFMDDPNCQSSEYVFAALDYLK